MSIEKKRLYPKKKTFHDFFVIAISIAGNNEIYHYHTTLPYKIPTKLLYHMEKTEDQITFL